MAACWVIVDADGSLNNAGGAAGATRPMLLSEWSTTITNPHQLQLMALDLNANYTLANNINLGPSLSNASDVWGPNGCAGFVPIGGNFGTNIDVHWHLQRQRQYDFKSDSSMQRPLD